MRDTEAALEQMTNQLLATETVGQMLVAFVVVGVMAGLSEELFFRTVIRQIAPSLACYIQFSSGLRVFFHDRDAASALRRKRPNKSDAQRSPDNVRSIPDAVYGFRRKGDVTNGF